MKKLLSVLAAVGLTATAGAGVVACGTKKDSDKKTDGKTVTLDKKDDGKDVAPDKKDEDKDKAPENGGDKQVDMSTYQVDINTGEIIG